MAVGDGVGVAVGDGVGVDVAVGDGVFVGVAVGVSVGVGVKVGAGVFVGTGVDVGEGVKVGVDVDVGTGVNVGVGVSVGDGGGIAVAVAVGGSGAAVGGGVGDFVSVSCGAAMDKDRGSGGLSGSASGDQHPYAAIDTSTAMPHQPIRLRCDANKTAPACVHVLPSNLPRPATKSSIKLNALNAGEVTTRRDAGEEH